MILAGVPVKSYLGEKCAMPFCKGCGHTHVLRRLNDALVALGIPPRDVSLVTDIGCIGLADGLFPGLHTVHTTHGRSTAFATGIELADSTLGKSKLKNIVLIGDGGAMIGLLHLVNAALLNVDVTVLLCNNFLFGMTGGQHSAFSPLNFVTPTTPEGNIVPPLDICKVVMDAHAGYVARKLSTDKDLAETIAAAVNHPGFALIEIVELCTEHGVARNHLTGNALRGILEDHGQKLGVLRDGSSREEFGTAYTGKFPRGREARPGKGGLEPKYETSLRRQVGVVVAGSAGERVQSAAGMFCEAAALSHLHCTQKGDNPVTQGSGFSLSEICISPRDIHYTGIERPDAVIAVSEEGVKELAERGTIARMAHGGVVILDASLEKPETSAEVYRMPFRALCGAERSAAAALEFYLELTGIFPVAAFDELLKARLKGGALPEEFLRAAHLAASPA